MQTMDHAQRSFHRFLEGDEEAILEVIDLFRESLIFFINRTVCDMAAAEDIAAASLAELVIHPGRYDFRYSLKTYLYTIARYKAANYVKRRALIRFVPLEEAPESASVGVSLEEQILGDERAWALHRAMEMLRPEYRTALHLLYFEEMSYADAARVMGKNTKQIDNLAARARAALRVVLEKEGFQNEK